MTRAAVLHHADRFRPERPDLPEPAGRLRLVPPDAVPPGARVVGVLIEEGPASGAAAVTAPISATVTVPSPSRGGIPAPARRPDPVVVDPDSRQVLAGGAVLDLTRREFDLLDRLTRAPGRVFRREQLLREVWSYDSDAYVSGRTVDVHVTRLRGKLGVHAHLLQTVRGVGYRWTERTPAATR